MKRNFVAVAVVALLFLLLAGCDQTPTPPISPLPTPTAPVAQEPPLPGIPVENVDVTPLVGYGLGALVSSALAFYADKIKKNQDWATYVQFIEKTVRGIEQFGVIEPALNTGEKKLEAALADIERFAQARGLKLELNEAELARTTRLLVEAVVNELKG